MAAHTENRVRIREHHQQFKDVSTPQSGSLQDRSIYSVYLETSLPLMLTQAKSGKCKIAQVVNWMSTAPAKAYGIPNKGVVAVGYDADLVLVDYEKYKTVLREEIKFKCGSSPFEGWNLTG